MSKEIKPGRDFYENPHSLSESELDDFSSVPLSSVEALLILVTNQGRLTKLDRMALEEIA